MAIDPPRRNRVTLCVDLDDNPAVPRAVHNRYGHRRGHLILRPGPDTGTTEDLMHETLSRLHVLWRLPTRLQRSCSPILGDDRAAVEWEMSWALTRAGITTLWVLNANSASAFAWQWARTTAHREQLRLILHTTAVPNFGQAAALTGCHVRMLHPARLRPAACTPPWWSAHQQSRGRLSRP